MITKAILVLCLALAGLVLMALGALMERQRIKDEEKRRRITKTFVDAPALKFKTNGEQWQGNRIKGKYESSQ